MKRLAYCVLSAIVISSSTACSMEAVDEARFWRLIAEAREAHVTQRVPMAETLTQTLVALEPYEIVSFQRMLARQRERCYQSELWGAAYLLNGGCSEDCFDYFQGWLIGQGRETFERALLDPETLTGFQPGNHEEVYEDELVLYAALEAYLVKTRTEMEDLAVPNKQDGIVPFKPDGLSARFPKLAGWVERQR